MSSEPRPPAIALAELRRRYEALGPIEELPGERTYLGRCYTFEQFLAYGPALAADWRDLGPMMGREPLVAQLAALACEAWPRALR